MEKTFNEICNSIKTKAKEYADIANKTDDASTKLIMRAKAIALFDMLDEIGYTEDPKESLEELIASLTD